MHCSVSTLSSVLCCYAFRRRVETSYSVTMLGPWAVVRDMARVETSYSVSTLWPLGCGQGHGSAWRLSYGVNTLGPWAVVRVEMSYSVTTLGH